MQANTMRARFMLKYEAARLANRTFNDREISDFLTIGEQELVKQRFAAFRNSKGIGMTGRPDIPQSGTVRSAELAGLLSATQQILALQMIKGTENNGALPNPDVDATDTQFGVFVSLPNDAMYLLNETVDTTFLDSTNTVKTRRNVPVLEVDYSYYNRGVQDYYAQPYHSLVWAMDWGTYTPGSFSSTTGLHTDSTKTYSTTGLADTYNMIGVSADPDAAISVTSGNLLVGNIYKVYGTVGQTVSYNSVTYAIGDTFTAVTGVLTFTGAGTVKDVTVKFSTSRSRYLLQGKDQTIKSYYCHYLKRPKGITVDVLYPANQVNSELAEFLHDEIVDYAVKLASAAIVGEQSKYQVNQLESKEDE